MRRDGPARDPLPVDPASGLLTVRVVLPGVLVRVSAPGPIARRVRMSFPRGPGWLSARDARETRSLVVLPADEPDRWRIVRDGESLPGAWPATEMGRAVEWAVNALAAETLARALLVFHAGAVALSGAGLLLPGRSGSGKSTLTGALALSGFEYLSDELGIVTTSGSVALLPYAKRVSLDAASQPLLAPLGDAAALATPRWPSGPVPLRLVVFPRHRPGAPPELTPLSRIEGARLLLAHAFGLAERGAEGFEPVTALLAAARCYTLSIDDLATAARQLRELLAAQPAS